MGETMQAVAVVPGKHELRLVEHPRPALSGSTQARVRILEVGVCGTDKEICAFEYGVPPQGTDALVIGHEALGEVVEVGPGVTGVSVGDLVVPMVRRPCTVADCFPCRSGRQDFCSTGLFTERGINQAHGFMTEEIVEDERYLVPVPRKLRDVAVLVEPLTIAEKALLQLRAVQSSLPWGCPHAASEGIGHCHKAVVLGAGPVGLLGAMALVVAGFETWVYSREPEGSPRADLVRSFGARYVSGAAHDVEALAQQMGRVDLVYEAVGVASLAFDLARFIAPNGVFVLTGVPVLKPAAPVESSRIMRQMVLGNQVVLGSVNSGRDGFEAAIRDLETFVERCPASVQALITGRFPVESFRDLLLGQPSGIKNLISVAPQAAAVVAARPAAAPAL